VPDLVEKFFQEDLSESEQDLLAQSLLESDDAAFQFSRLAREAYLRFGLPEPEPKWKDSPPSFGAGMGGIFSPLGMIFLAFGLAALGAGAAWHFGFLPGFSKPPACCPVGVCAPLASGKGSLTAPGGSSGPRLPGLEGPRKNRAKIESEAASSAGSLPAVTPSASSAAREEAIVPVNLDIHPAVQFPNLSVVVNQAQAGPLKVSVLDPSGAEARVLYQGPLAPGHWVFEWNGLLAGNRKPPAGFYQIQVQSGLFAQQKMVQIQ
jgi:hypothetical protein